MKRIISKMKSNCSIQFTYGITADVGTVNRLSIVEILSQNLDVSGTVAPATTKGLIKYFSSEKTESVGDAEH